MFQIGGRRTWWGAGRFGDKNPQLKRPSEKSESLSLQGCLVLGGGGGHLFLL